MSHHRIRSVGAVVRIDGRALKDLHAARHAACAARAKSDSAA